MHILEENTKIRKILCNGFFLYSGGARWKWNVGMKDMYFILKTRGRTGDDLKSKDTSLKIWVWPLNLENQLLQAALYLQLYTIACDPLLPK